MRSVPGGSRVLGRVLRGKVLFVYLPDDPDHPGAITQTTRVGPLGTDGQVPEITEPRIAPKNRRGIVCDVLVFGDGRRTVLRMVPVFSGRGGRSNSDRWIPQGTRNSVAGSGAIPTKMLAAGDPAQAITQPVDLDGDTVLVEFLDGDYQKPFIRSAGEHWHSEETIPAYRPPTADQGETNERTIRHRGSIVRLDSDGNIKISAVGASSGVLDETGAEVRGPQGNVTVQAKAKLTIRLEGVDPLGGTDPCDIELAPTGGAATRNMAAVGDNTKATLSIVPATPNVELATFLTAIGAAFAALGAPVPPPAGLTYPDWATFASAVLGAGIDADITTGNPNVRTD